MIKGEVHEVLRVRLRGVHDHLDRLFRGVGRALSAHLARTEAALAEAVSKDREDPEARLAEIGARLARLEQLER